MLQLRPSCEHCNKLLPPASDEAMICSYECTFCRDCVALLQNVCPNCGGAFVPRPIRPAHEWRTGATLARHPATTQVTWKPVDLDRHAELVNRAGTVPADRR